MQEALEPVTFDESRLCLGSQHDCVKWRLRFGADQFPLHQFHLTPCQP